MATAAISQATFSKRIEASLRKVGARYNLLSIHIRGKLEDQVRPCAQCAEKDAHPSDRAKVYCPVGAAFRDDLYEAYASVWYQVAEARRGAGREVRAAARRIDEVFSLDTMKAEIQHFLDYEFEVAGKPRGLKRAPANMWQIGEIFSSSTPARR